ncbi:phosphate acetyltransferase [Thiomicrospira sp. WB1]|uniref:phosphate acetyltransferase n=1 Tax=Thiomicrospira sp. WB1 TaxID=1685380 RepID=UPI00074A543A|nr:phosphate acetyltransferase [Thiomicrospira sp. WB1]KUJ71261.1 phosphate acetyltransferase [Thiomicrospira sp. WB1]
MQSNHLFIAPRERHAGSLLVSLGLMSILRQKFEKIAFFRPVVTQTPDPDAMVIREVFDLSQPLEDMTGVTLDEASQWIGHDQTHQLYTQLLSQLQALQHDYDFVLIQGAEMTRHTTGLDLDLNLALAREFNSPYVPVLNGQARDAEAIENEIEMERHASGKVAPFALFVNRIDPSQTDALNAPERPFPMFFIPESAELNTPTMLEVAQALEAEWLTPPDQGCDRLVQEPIVAAMTVEHYLPRVNEGDLVIVPGDRSDILLGSVMSLFARNMPNIAGIMLTGGFRPNAVIQDLLHGFQIQDLPIVVVPTDTYPTAMHASQVRARLQARAPRKINLALGLFDQAVDRTCLTEKLLARVSDHRHSITTPVMFEYALFEQARQSLQTIVLPEAQDERILRATDVLLHRQVVRPILLGQPEDIRYRASLLGLDFSNVEIIDPAQSPWREDFIDTLYQLRQHKGLSREGAADAISHVSVFATLMVQCGHADGMVSGATHTTADTIRPALQIIKTRPDVSLVSSVFFMCFQTRVLVYGDCAVNQNPNAEQLAEIAISSAETAHRFSIDPKVALLSYSTGDSGHGSEVEKVREATRLAKTKRPDLLIEGPIQYDAAIDADVARQKLPESRVAGQATVFVFPDLNTGNNTYKAVQRASGAIAIGPVLQGLNKPVNDLSRGCSVADVINTVAITAIQAQSTQVEGVRA